MLCEPRRPVRPPAAGMTLRMRKPIVRISGQMVIQPIIAALLCRWIDHTRDMTRRAEHERRASSEQCSGAIRALPRHDVIFLRGEYISGKGDAREIDGNAFHRQRTVF